MTSDPLTQAYIPKTMGQMVWVCGPAGFGLGSLVKALLKNKDLGLIFGSVLGSVALFFGAFRLTQPAKKIKGLGQPAVWKVFGLNCRGKIGSDFRPGRTGRQEVEGYPWPQRVDL
jgi:hypothetical protein